jgi:tRNA (guanine26-N2/guanine27-N2)-dimethyltransferase
MTGSGVRAVRYVLETSCVKHVLASDRDVLATRLARETVLLNGLEDKISVVQDDAYTLLSAYAAKRFDIIDLDPFGTPAPFFESALRATVNEGVIAATATDMGPLSGARPTACLRKYGVSPIRTEFEKEMAVRALAFSLSAIACKLELGIDIAFSHATDHYARLYAVVRKGRKAANQTLTNLGYLIYCPACLYRTEAQSITSVRSTCANCGGIARVGGPYWLGPIWDEGIVERMVALTPAVISSRLSELQKMLARVQDEVTSPRFYYTTGATASRYRVKPPSLELLIDSLRSCGHLASRTHFNSTGFRTDASLRTIIRCFRAVTEKP